MAIPEKILINREENYHTHYLGEFGEDKMFMGFVVATVPMPLSHDWQDQKRWYAVLHRFDGDGNHQETEVWFAGVSSDGELSVTQKARQRLESMIAALGKHQLGDVCVRLFSTQVQGELFGLVEAEGEGEEVHLLPNQLYFAEPWDGSYDT